MLFGRRRTEIQRGATGGPPSPPVHPFHAASAGNDAHDQDPVVDMDC